VHGRSVKEGYHSDVHYDFIGLAARRVRCPVLANGNVSSADMAAQVLATTGAAGVMIGRHAIRNPWIFRQTREKLTGQPVTPITLGAVREYIDRLYRTTQGPGVPERAHVAKMKKYLNFVGQSVDADSAFLRDMRRAMTEAELFAVCDRHLLAEPGRHFSAEPYPGVIARPNCETPLASCSLDSVTA
jgi:tRNA-dihydrouridine synthase